jgi:hypothetical protein
MAIVDSLVVAIMSYNRAQYLLNCIASTERSLPDVPIWIFDDASDDAETRVVLAELAGRHQVFVRPKDNLAVGHLGGLYGNMARALEMATARGIKYIFLMQDDMQFVRRCDAMFWRQCEIIFSIDDILQINASFFKGFYTDKFLEQSFSIDDDNGFYDPMVSGFADTGILDMTKAAAAGLRLRGSEGETGKALRQQGFRMVCHRDPVAMHTPWPETLRKGNWKQRILQFVNELGTRAGCHPYLEMTDRDAKRLVGRSINEFPIADKFLKTKTVLKQPWWYASSFSQEKITRFDSFVKLTWIFDGTPQYIELSKKLEDERKLRSGPAITDDGPKIDRTGPC